MFHRRSDQLDVQWFNIYVACRSCLETLNDAFLGSLGPRQSDFLNSCKFGHKPEPTPGALRHVLCSKQNRVYRDDAIKCQCVRRLHVHQMACAHLLNNSGFGLFGLDGFGQDLIDEKQIKSKDKKSNKRRTHAAVETAEEEPEANKHLQMRTIHEDSHEPWLKRRRSKFNNVYSAKTSRGGH